MINLYNRQEISTEASEKFNAKNNANEKHIFKFRADKARATTKNEDVPEEKGSLN